MALWKPVLEQTAALTSIKSLFTLIFMDSPFADSLFSVICSFTTVTIITVTNTTVTITTVTIFFLGNSVLEHKINHQFLTCPPQTIAKSDQTAIRV